MSDCYEMRVAEYEHARNEAMDKWFGARPLIERNQRNEKIFEAGFRMAYEARETPPNTEAQPPAEGGSDAAQC